MIVMQEKQWIPPSSFEEKLKEYIIPPRFFIRRIAKREWEKGEKELKLLPFLVDRSRNSVDAGAYRGVYSYYLAQLCRHVYTFEPNPKMYRTLKRNVARNVTTYPYALSNKTGTAELIVPKKGRRRYSNQRSSLSTKKVDGPHGTVVVQAKRLDDLGLKDIGFMKIDVEGFEQEVLDGARETIKTSRPNLLIEMEERHTKESIEESISQVEQLGYNSFVIIRGQLVSIDNFDPEENHRNVPAGGDYIFNFIFLPKIRTANAKNITGFS